MNAVRNLLLPDGRIGVTESGTICVELPAPDMNTFAMSLIPYQAFYECTLPGGIRNGVRFEIDNPEIFTICDEVDALVTIPEKLLELFPDLPASIIETIKEAIHDNWREPSDAQEFVRDEIIAKHTRDESWD